MVADIPGEKWLAIISRPTLEGFSAACTPGLAMSLSATEEPGVGPAAVRHFFNIPRTMYDGFAFVHEARDASRTYLEWEGRFQGSPVSGATILSYSESGLIREIQLYHRPYGEVLAFAAELAQRLAQPCRAPRQPGAERPAAPASGLDVQDCPASPGRPGPLASAWW